MKYTVFLHVTASHSSHVRVSVHYDIDTVLLTLHHIDWKEVGCVIYSFIIYQREL